VDGRRLDLSSTAITSVDDLQGASGARPAYAPDPNFEREHWTLLVAITRCVAALAREPLSRRAPGAL
jgi:hypothetical protein